MTCKKIRDDEYLFTYNKYIDPFDYKKLTIILSKIFNRFFKYKKIIGIYNFHIYINYNNPKIKLFIIRTNSKYMDIKLFVHFNNLVLYKINNYDFVNTIKNKKTYYYNNNYYIELVNDIKYNEMLLLEEISDCICGEDALEIIHKGVQLCEKM